MVVGRRSLPARWATMAGAVGALVCIGFSALIVFGLHDRAVERMVALVHPSLRMQVVVATNAASPGSPIARAFAAVSAGLSYDERFALPVGVAADA